MPSVTSTNVANAIVKLVAVDALPALMGNLVMGNLVNRDFEPTLGQAGDTVNVPIPPVLVALVQLGPGPALGVAIGYAVINVVIGSAVEPRVMGRALGLSPLVVLVSLVFWGRLWGPVGALLSAPLTMVVKVAVANTKDMRWLAIFLGSAGWVEQMNGVWASEASADGLPGKPAPQPADQGPPAN